jgi:Protein of unknown function, DUF488
VDFQIGYEHLAALGGLRHKRNISPAVNGFWQNPSFHNYADYAMTEDFHAGLDRLRCLGHQTPTAIMCAEAVWWQCHRRIIADYLMEADEIVFHIMGLSLHDEEGGLLMRHILSLRDHCCRAACRHCGRCYRRLDQNGRDSKPLHSVSASDEHLRSTAHRHEKFSG